MQKIFLFSLCCLFFWGIAAAQDLPRSHAHNDYEKWGRKSLYRALQHGFLSIEIDIFCLAKGAEKYEKKHLRIAHIPLFLRLRPNLEDRYFRRMRHWLREHPRPADAPPIILMLDLKNAPAAAYYQLRQLCEKYADMLCIYYPKSDSLRRGAVQILLSGSKPAGELLADTVHYMALDMGLGTIGDSVLHARIAPRVSSSYRGNFRWRGAWGKKMPEKELAHLRDCVKKAHADGRELRFWAMPNRRIVWQTFSQEGVDWLNIDRLRRYQRWRVKSEK